MCYNTIRRLQWNTYSYRYSFVWHVYAGHESSTKCGRPTMKTTEDIIDGSTGKNSLAWCSKKKNFFFLRHPNKRLENKTMKSCEKCGTHKNITRHHILPRCVFHGRGGICYLCRCHHDEVERRIMKTEKQMLGDRILDGPSKRFILEEHEYREILQDYLNETTPMESIKFPNVVALRRKFGDRAHRVYWMVHSVNWIYNWIPTIMTHQRELFTYNYTGWVYWNDYLSFMNTLQGDLEGCCFIH